MAPDDPTLTRNPAPADADTLAPAPGAAGPLPPLPGYDLERELGRGAMGVVYRARQVKANRPVAVKVILSGAYAGDADRRRFQAEAEAIARLDHPNVVRVFDVGEAAGTPYFALELCPGGTLAQKLDGTPWPARPAAETVAALADGVAAAHAHGIVHRDLKPGNVLIAADGTPKVTDFGLAKSTAGDSGLTATGAVLGTPSYMAPEQTSGAKAVGPAADVYSLGAILYELLTGRPPFKGATVLDTLDQVRRAEPAAPRALNPQAPRDLETICMKCLQKDPARRYGSSADLGADLRRFLADEPIRARPVGRLERTRKWVKRNPAVAGLLAGVVLLTAGAFTAVTLALIEAESQQVQAELRRKDLLAINDDLRQAQNDLTAATWTAREAAEANAVNGYFSSVGLAQRLWQAGDVGAARRELDRCPERFRHWEWKYLDRLCREAGTAIPIRGLPLHLSYTPDGQYLVCGMVSDRIALYRIVDGQEVWKGPIWPASPPMLAVHRSGKQLAYVSPGKAGPTGPGRQVVRVVGIPGGEVQAEYPVPLLLLPDNPAVALAWDRDDRLLLGWFAKNAHPVTFETWDLAAKKTVATGVAFRPAKQMIVKIEMPAFSPDGRRLAAVAQDIGFVRPAVGRGADEPEQFAGRLGVWDAATGKEVATAAVESGGQPGLAFSPDGRFLAWGNGTRVAELDLDRPGPPRTLAAHAEPVWDVAYSPDGRSLASGGDDRVVRVWDRAEGREAYTLRGAAGIVRVAFAPGGREVAAADASLFATGGRAVRRWPAADPAAQSFGGPPPPLVSACLGLAPRPGRYVAFDTRLFGEKDHGRLTVHDPAGDRPIPLEAGAGFFDAALSADGRRLAVLDNGVRVVDADTGAELARFPLPRESGLLDGLDTVALSADGRRVAHGRVVGRQPAGQAKADTRLVVRVWDVDTRRPAGEFAEPVHSPGGKQVLAAIPLAWLAFDPAGGRVAAAFTVLGMDTGDLALVPRQKAVVAWDLAGGTRAFGADLRFVPRALAFAPDGHLAVGGGLGGEGEVSLLDGTTGEERMSVRGHAQPVLALAFSPDGRRLVTAGEDRLVKVWSWGAGGGRELVTLAGHTRVVTAARFTPDGRSLLTGTGLDRMASLTSRGGATPDLQRPMEVKAWDAGP